MGFEKLPPLRSESHTIIILDMKFPTPRNSREPSFNIETHFFVVPEMQSVGSEAVCMSCFESIFDFLVICIVLSKPLNNDKSFCDRFLFGTKVQHLIDFRGPDTSKRWPNTTDTRLLMSSFLLISLLTTNTSL